MEVSKTVKIITTLHGDFAVDMESDAKIGRALASGAYHQEDALELLSLFVTPESTVVDIGAHIGTLAVPLAALAHTVIAFEPAPETFALLERNAALNHSSIDLRNKGLGVRSGYAKLQVSNPHNAGAHSLSLDAGDIPISTLDEEVEEADVIKIDAEGMEADILQGGSKLIARSKPVVLFEVNLSQLRTHKSSPTALEKFWSKQGYQLYLPWHIPGKIVLGRISNLAVISACTTPGAWLRGRGSAPFDVIAIPVGKHLPVPTMSSLKTVLHTIAEYSKQKFFS